MACLEKVLIAGLSGTGKTTSLRNLDMSTVAYINFDNKKFPFRPKGELKLEYKDEDLGRLNAFMKAVVDNPNIKILVLDTVNTFITNYYISKAGEKSYDKFTEMAVIYHRLIQLGNQLRPDQTYYMIAHVTPIRNARGEEVLGIRTHGKFVNEKIVPESLFNVVLLSHKEADLDNNVEYSFLTNGTSSICKSPIGMFETEKVPNDLELVDRTIREFYSPS